MQGAYVQVFERDEYIEYGLGDEKFYLRDDRLSLSMRNRAIFGKERSRNLSENVTRHAQKETLKDKVGNALRSSRNKAEFLSFIKIAQ